MSGLLFIAAPGADHKLINRLLLFLKDWEYDSGDRFKLVTSRSIDALRREPSEPPPAISGLKPTSAPVDPGLANEWSGASIADVEAFCLDLDKSDFKGANTHLFVALDEDGLADQTCVLAERVINWDAEPLRYPEQFNKARVPWYQAYLSWANLDISNIGWEEMMKEDPDGEGDGGWWDFNDDDGGEYISDEKRRLRDEEISRLEGEGRALE